MRQILRTAVRTRFLDFPNARYVRSPGIVVYHGWVFISLTRVCMEVVTLKRT